MRYVALSVVFGVLVVSLGHCKSFYENIRLHEGHRVTKHHSTSRQDEFDVGESELSSRESNDEKPMPEGHIKRDKSKSQKHGKHHHTEDSNEFDVEVTNTEQSSIVSSPHENDRTTAGLDEEEPTQHWRKGKIDNVGEKSKNHKKGKQRKKQMEEQSEQERGWHYCSDGKKPKNIKDIIINETAYGSLRYMCHEMYPISTCCYEHDLSMELIGDKILEQIPDVQCARMLMKLRCAHCSPRSWWLFHAPDMRRLPHKRVLPIMCPSFCKRFHRLCRDSVQGLEGDDFCDYHITNEDGPCFPDSVIRRGSID